MLVRRLDALLMRFSSSLSRSLVSVYDVEELAADVADVSCRLDALLMQQMSY